MLRGIVLSGTREIATIFARIAGGAGREKQVLERLEQALEWRREWIKWREKNQPNGANATNSIISVGGLG